MPTNKANDKVSNYYLIGLQGAYEQGTNRPALILLFSDKRDPPKIVAKDGTGAENIEEVSLVFGQRMPIREVARFLREAANHLETQALKMGIKGPGENGGKDE